MELLKLCSTQDVPPGEMNQFELRGKELLVVNVEGRLYCLDARCTHAGAPLAEGNVEGDQIVCPWHYSRFRVADGSVAAGPAQKPLATHKLLVKDGDVFIEASECRRELPG